jgi:hypothetical protein
MGVDSVSREALQPSPQRLSLRRLSPQRHNHQRRNLRQRNPLLALAPLALLLPPSFQAIIGSVQW